MLAPSGYQGVGGPAWAPERGSLHREVAVLARPAAVVRSVSLVFTVRNREQDVQGGV